MAQQWSPGQIVDSVANWTLPQFASREIQTQGVTGAEAPPEMLVNAATNRLTGVSYSPAGDVYSFGESSYRWDELNAMIEKIEGGVATRYTYAPGGERLSATSTAGVTRWTLRGLGNQVIRQLEQDAAGTWTWQRDYIHAGRLLASVAPGNEGLRHYHLDHLGSTRAVSNAAGTILARHTYLPFGQEITDPAQSGSALKYTGHERDEGANSVSRMDDLDYMHARYCSPAVGRFLGIDPVLGKVEVPQSWNRYGYVRGNPMVLVDPTGENTVVTCGMNQTCVASVDAQIVVPNFVEHAAVEAAADFKEGAEAYWNAQSVQVGKENLTFSVSLEIVAKGQEREGIDTLTVINGAGRTAVDQNLVRYGSNMASPPDQGRIFTTDTTNNPGGLKAIGAHEVGHLMGLRDMYLPGEVVPLDASSGGDIMRHGQLTNSAPTVHFLMRPNGNSVLIRWYFLPDH